MSRFASDLARFGSAIALIDESGPLTYDALEARVAACAALLGSERRLVQLHIEPTVDSVVAYLAALRGEHPVILCAPGAAEVFDPDVVITGGVINERRCGTRHELHDDLALLLSTSGSTGAAKLVRLSRTNLQSNAEAIAEMLGVVATDRAITSLPLHYCYGLSVLNSHLATGAAVVLSRNSVVDACFWSTARACNVTTFAGVPHTFELLDRVGFTGNELPTLRYVTQAGGRLDPAHVARYAAMGFDLVVMYGQTEATARMAYLPPALVAAHPDAIGRAIPGGELRIDDTGELIYRGANVMMGFATTPSDLAKGAELAELRTGDLATQTPDGLFKIVGRASRFIKPFGVRIDLDDTERLLAAAGIPALCTGDDRGLAVAVSTIDVTRATAVLHERVGLPASNLTVRGWPELPRLANGKPDYQAVAAAAPVTNAPTTLRDAFRLILGVDPSPTDTFVSLGGDSLSYVEMSIALEDHLGSLPDGWHAMPFAELDAPPSKRQSRLARVDTTVVVRAVAIVMIVGRHTGMWAAAGGAHALVAVAGFNIARFQLNSRSILRSAARVAIPSAVLIGAMSVFSSRYGWTHALLVNDLIGPKGSLWSFWFVEGFVQISLVLAALFAVPAVARLERERPLAVAYGAVGIGLLFRYEVLFRTPGHRITWPYAVFFLFALGWVAARVPSTGHRVLLSVMSVGALWGYFADDARSHWVMAGVLVVVWLRTVPVPRPLVRLMTPLASSSLYIYVTHFAFEQELQERFGSAVALVVCLAVGVVVARIAQRVERVVRTRKLTGIMLTASKTSAGSAALSNSDSLDASNTEIGSVSSPNGRSSTVAGSSLSTSTNTSDAPVAMAGNNSGK